MKRGERNVLRFLGWLAFFGLLFTATEERRPEGQRFDFSGSWRMTRGGRYRRIPESARQSRIDRLFGRIRRDRRGMMGRRTVAGVSRLPTTFDRTIPITAVNTLGTVAAGLPNGGSIYVKGPGTYHATGPIALASGGNAVNNVDVYFGAGSQIVIDAGATFTTSKISPATSWSNLLDWSNCNNCNIYNWYCVNNLVNNSVNCMHVGGNSSHLRFIDCYSKGFTRWHTFVNAYSSGVTGLGTQDGNVDDILVVRPVGVNMGNTTTPDGGMIKIGNQSQTSPQAVVSNIWAEEVDVTGLNFALFDCTMTSEPFEQSTTNYNFGIRGGRAIYTAGLTIAPFAVWVENSANWLSYRTPIRGVEVSDVYIDMNGCTGANSVAVLLNGGANAIKVTRVVARGNNSGWGLRIDGAGNGAPARVCKDIKVRDCTFYGQKQGIAIRPDQGTTNTVVQDVLLDGITLDDDGQGTMTTGIKLTSTSTNPMRNVVIRRVDATNLAINATPLDLSGLAVDSNIGETSIQFERCPGVTPLGAWAANQAGVSVTDTDSNIIGVQPIGAAATPTSTTVYYVQAKAGISLSTAASGTRTALSILDAAGFPLQAFTQISSASGSAASPTSGKTYTVIAEDITITMAQGSGTPTVTILDAAGNQLFAAGTSVLTAQFIPRGATIAVTGTVAGSTWTIVGAVNGAIATPFLDSMSGVAIPALVVPFGGSVTETNSVATTWTVKMNKFSTHATASVASPFGQMRQMGLTSGTAALAVTTAKFYKAGMDLVLDLDLTTANSITIVDQYGNTVTTPLDASGTHVYVSVLAGYVLKPAFTTLTSMTIADGSS